MLQRALRRVRQRQKLHNIGFGFLAFLHTLSRWAIARNSVAVYSLSHFAAANQLVMSLTFCPQAFHTHPVCHFPPLSAGISCIPAIAMPSHPSTAAASPHEAPAVQTSTIYSRLTLLPQTLLNRLGPLASAWCLLLVCYRLLSVTNPLPSCLTCTSPEASTLGRSRLRGLPSLALHPPSKSSTSTVRLSSRASSSGALKNSDPSRTRLDRSTALANVEASVTTNIISKHISGL